MLDNCKDSKEIFLINKRRFLIRTDFVDEWLFDSYKLKTFGETRETKLFLSQRCVSGYSPFPKYESFIDDKVIKIELINDSGVVLNYLDLTVELESFEINGDDTDDGLMKIEYVFWVKSITTMNDKEIDAKIKENYLEKYPDRNKDKY